MALSSKSISLFNNSTKTPFFSITKPQTHNQITFTLKSSPPKTTTIHHTQHQQHLSTLPTLSNNHHFHGLEFYHHDDDDLIKLTMESPRDPFRFSSSSLCYNNNNDDEIEIDIVSVAFPTIAYANTLFFKSAYNLQIIVSDHEPEEKLVGRFRSAVLKAGIIQESKRRRFFETNREKIKRKAREASRRYRKRRLQPKASKQDKQQEVSKGYNYESGDDNWEFRDVDLPYC